MYFPAKLHNCTWSIRVKKNTVTSIEYLVTTQEVFEIIIPDGIIALNLLNLDPDFHQFIIKQCFLSLHFELSSDKITMDCTTLIIYLDNLPK